MLADRPNLSIPEAAIALDVSESSIRRWIKSGRLRVIEHPSGRYRVPREDVEAILKPAVVGVP